MDEIFNDSEELELTDEAISAGWDDPEDGDAHSDPEDEPDTADESGDEAPEEDEAEGEEEGGEDGEAEDKDTGDKAEDQRFTLRHLDKDHSVTLEEMKTLAQKGLDYDRIRSQNDAYKKAEDGYGALLQALAKHDGTDVDGIVDSLWAGLIAEEDGVDSAVALERAKARRIQKQLDAKNAADQQSEEDREAEEKRREGFLAFSKSHPDVKPQDIPAEVWQRVNGGMSLPDAYGLYELAQLREENKRLKDKAAVAEKKAENGYRATGSAATSGKTPKAKFDIYAGFDD